MKELLKVEGMSCGHCVKAVEDNVGELTGVSNAAAKNVKREPNTIFVVPAPASVTPTAGPTKFNFVAAAVIVTPSLAVITDDGVEPPATIDCPLATTTTLKVFVLPVTTILTVVALIATIDCGVTTELSAVSHTVTTTLVVPKLWTKSA